MNGNRNDLFPVGVNIDMMGAFDAVENPPLFFENLCQMFTGYGFQIVSS